MKSVYSVFLMLMFLMFSCKTSNDGFSVHSSGLQYKFFDTNTSGATPETGDIVVLSLKYRTADDRLVDESDFYRMQVTIPVYQGDFHTGLRMLQVGDSVCFKIEAVNFYERTRKMDLPVEFQQGDFVYIYLRLKDIISASSFERERINIYHTDEQQELNLLAGYLERANVEIEPHESGLYVIHKKEGAGPLAKAGNTLSVHYSGTTIDGKLFDTSLDKGRPFKFVLGRSEVIKGWEEGFLELKKGGKAKFIIPSSLAYGKEGWGNTILPYSSLVFDVELIDIK